MVKLPPNLTHYRQKARQAIARGLVKEIEFSGATYQVLVQDPTNQKECWVFLQLESKGFVKDAFCSCEEVIETEEISHPCLHLAIAYLSLYGKYQKPLHERFASSLWNKLCHICFEQLGDDLAVLATSNTGHYTCLSSSEKVIAGIQAKSQESIRHLEYILKQRPDQTEETSLKFSNLPHEEILLWQEGKPSLELRYELSFWSDLAKWLLKMQEEELPYEISFDYSKRQLPNWIQIKFEQLEVGFYLAEANLPIIIPALALVHSPLKVQNIGRQSIGSIIYDKQKGILHIKAKNISSSEDYRKVMTSSSLTIHIDGWIYVPKESFLAEEPHILLQTPILEGEDLSHALTEHGRLIATFLPDLQVHFDPIPISHHLFFDKDWNLHIVAYVFEPGDLTDGNSRLIGDWAYLDVDGFYHLEGKRFDEIETIIPLYQVADFVTQNRAWLNRQEGFHTHVKSLEYQLSYTVTANNRLTFTRTLAQVKESAKMQDFGAWVYLEGYGFYSKAVSSSGFLLRPGLSLSAEQIPLFIKMNREELAFIPQFFNPICPIHHSTLKVELIDKQGIKVTPEYQLLPAYQNKPFRLFDDFVYVEEEGFSELPVELRLPEKFRQEMILEGEEVNLFLTYEFNEIQKYVHFIDPRLVKPKENVLSTKKVALAEDKGKGWYRFELYYKTERGLISIIELWEMLRKKETFAFFEAGLIELNNKRYDWLRQLRKERIEKETHQVLITTLEFMRLNAFDPIQLLEQGASDKLSSQELLDELTHLRTPDEPNFGGLVSHLRPYQEIGVRWLWFLYHQQLSGLLCDDMGLGKTHQAMALLASIANFYRSYAEGIKHQFLIVCPTSVIYHWQEKLNQFLPGLKVYTFYGTNRNLEEFKNQYDILLTSYGILRNEQDLISKIDLEVAIFDEIQIAKNQLSRVYAALKRIKAHMKVGLTGTPIENYLRELKSLFDIVLPSYMPGDAEFREFFIRPIEKERNLPRQKLLNRMIHPFVLRRKKEEVLKELPEKIEEIAYCDLLSYQQHLYTDVLQRRRKYLIDELTNEAMPIPFMHIFALLSSLKQICDHPAVYLKCPEDYQKYHSGKWELFLELLREARESQQKVVIFSQYLGMLDIIERYLSDHHIGFASLRGATQNRKEQLQLFNRDPKCEVFVGSLRAAGLGIDLTAGSVVIHYDRWWNAARENQATDRVHRMGQTRGVQVFKLVTKNTFEEKIDAMILRKGQLMESTIGVDDQTTLKKFSRDELLELLTFVDTGQHQDISDAEIE